MSEKTDPRLLWMWRQSLLDGVRAKDQADLTLRQTALLLTVYMNEPPHTVRGLAAELNVAKPVITRALDTLSRKGFLKRVTDPDDKRSVLIQRTVKGAVFLSELSERIAVADKASHDLFSRKTAQGAATDAATEPSEEPNERPSESEHDDRQLTA